jgi:hypothetical protein
MKPPPSPSDWNDLTRRARKDLPPATDLDGLLRTLPAVRAQAPIPRARPGGFLGEFAAVFSLTRSLIASATIAVAAIAWASWQGLSAWEEMGAMAEVASVTFGGEE